MARFSYLFAVLGLGLLPLTATAGEVARATWYGPDHAGRPTANGEMFDPWAMTAAHPTLPMGTLVEVKRLTKNAKNGAYHSVIVRINDRLPAGRGRIDLSEGAARVLRFRNNGGGPVEITVLPQIASAR